MSRSAKYVIAALRGGCREATGDAVSTMFFARRIEYYGGMLAGRELRVMLWPVMSSAKSKSRSRQTPTSTLARPLQEVRWVPVVLTTALFLISFTSRVQQNAVLTKSFWAAQSWTAGLAGTVGASRERPRRVRPSSSRLCAPSTMCRRCVSSRSMPTGDGTGDQFTTTRGYSWHNCSSPTRSTCSSAGLGAGPSFSASAPSRSSSAQICFCGLRTIGSTCSSCSSQ